MKNTCKCELRAYMSKCLAETRREQHLSQGCKDKDAVLDDMKVIILKACNGAYPGIR